MLFFGESIFHTNLKVILSSTKTHIQVKGCIPTNSKSHALGAEMASTPQI